MLLARDLWLLLVSQTVFGLAVGLLYYSSLFYSMDVGETKGEHGGIHEAAIGAGNATGPAMAAAALAVFPELRRQRRGGGLCDIARWFGRPLLDALSPERLKAHSIISLGGLSALTVRWCFWA